MKLPASQALYGYWNTLRGPRSAPDRRDLDLAQMRGMLAHTFMLDVDAVDAAARRYPILISGTRFDALFGRSLTGDSFTNLWSSVDRATISDLLDGVLALAQPTVIGLAGAPEGYADCAFELLVLPLRHEGRTHSRLLCSLVPVRTPEWIGLRTISTLSLTTWRALASEEHATREPALRATRTADPRRTRLVVIEGGRGGMSESVEPSQARVNSTMRRSGTTSSSIAFHDSAAPARSST